MSLRALDGDTAYHADLRERAQAATGIARLHMARFYGKLEQSKDYENKDRAHKAICGAQSEAELQAALDKLALELPNASSGTRRKWKRAAETRRWTLQGYRPEISVPLYKGDR